MLRAIPAPIRPRPIQATDNGIPGILFLREAGTEDILMRRDCIVVLSGRVLQPARCPVNRLEVAISLLTGMWDFPPGRLGPHSDNPVSQDLRITAERNYP